MNVATILKQKGRSCGTQSLVRGAPGRRDSSDWRNMDRASGEHRRCVAACIGAEI
jgi:hypothetical protein